MTPWDNWVRLHGQSHTIVRYCSQAQEACTLCQIPWSRTITGSVGQCLTSQKSDPHRIIRSDSRQLHRLGNPRSQTMSDSFRQCPTKKSLGHYLTFIGFSYRTPEQKWTQSQTMSDDDWAEWLFFSHNYKKGSLPLLVGWQLPQLENTLLTHLSSRIQEVYYYVGLSHHSLTLKETWVNVWLTRPSYSVHQTKCYLTWWHIVGNTASRTSLIVIKRMLVSVGGGNSGWWGY